MLLREYTSNVLTLLCAKQLIVYEGRLTLNITIFIPNIMCLILMILKIEQV